MLEPAYEVAGDVFDYAINGDTAHVAIFDAMGHSLRASLIAAVAVASYRNCRRGSVGLEKTLTTMDQALNAEFGDESFATALLAELDLSSGQVRAIMAGHAAPLLLRQGRVVRGDTPEPTLPLGLGADPATVTEYALEPGDRLLLFTDGIVEARSEAGEFFGEQRLVELLSKEAAAGNASPETVRRLVRAVVEHQSRNLQDDATLLVVEWLGRAQDRGTDLYRLV
jgi:serine phosphatase RsbU (regulator of sigma subunit)